MTRISKGLSYLLHPIMMPTYGLILLFRFNSYLSYSFQPALIKVIFGVVIFTTIIFPAMATYILKQKGYIQSLQMQSREERILPFVIASLSYCIGYFLLRKLMLPPLINLLFLSSTASVIVATLINLRWKISIHMIGIGGIAGMLFGLSQKIVADMLLPIMISIVLAGILGSARIYLGSHDNKQIYAGFLTGFFITAFLIIL